MDPRTWEAAEWGAFGQVGALVVATIAGVLVWLQVRHGRQVREDQTRPYVIADFEFKGQFVQVAVGNIGTTPARDVRFEFNPPLQAGDGSDPEELAIFSDGIPMLAPGRRIAIPYGNGPSIFSDDVQDRPLRYDVVLTYTDLTGKRTYADPPLVLDLAPYKHTLVENDDLHQIYQNLKDMKMLMKSWTSEQRLRVNTITQAEVNERNRERYEQRRAQQWQRIKVEEESPPDPAAESDPPADE